MSLKSFLHKLWESIKHAFNSVEAEVKKEIHVAIVVTSAVKKFVDSPAADVVTSLIPGDVDEKIKEKLRQLLPAIILKLGWIEEISNIPDVNDQLQAILGKLKFANDDAKDAFYHSFGSLLIKDLSDGKFSWSEAVQLAEFYYKSEYKPTL